MCGLGRCYNAANGGARGTAPLEKSLEIEKRPSLLGGILPFRDSKDSGAGEAQN